MLDEILRIQDKFNLKCTQIQNFLRLIIQSLSSLSKEKCKPEEKFINFLRTKLKNVFLSVDLQLD